MPTLSESLLWLFSKDRVAVPLVNTVEMSGQFLEVTFFHTPLVVSHARKDLFGPVDFKEWFFLATVYRSQQSGRRHSGDTIQERNEEF